MELIASTLCRKDRPVMHRQVDARLVSPVSLIRELGLGNGDCHVLLDSAGGNPHLCRYSFLAWDPLVRMTVKDGRATLASGERRSEIAAPDPFALIRRLLAELAPRRGPKTTLPLTGGAFEIGRAHV